MTLTMPNPTVSHDPISWAEIDRICSLIRTAPMTPEEYDLYNRTHVQAPAYEAGFRLAPLQAEAVAAYEIYGGLFGAICVGGGKTLVSLMCAASAYSRGLTRILLFVPPEVLAQLTLTDIPWARSRVQINYPIHVLGGRTMEYRRALCASDRKGLYVMPYSLLSTPDTSDNLEAINPQVIIADEAHRLANHSAARTRRFLTMMRKLKERGNSPELVLLSGTITGKSIKDYYHLIKPCLRENCPLPLSDRMATDWSVLIDAVASGPEAVISPLGTAPIIPIVDWARKNYPHEKGGFPEDVHGFRRAFQKRLTSAPGVVASGENEVGTSLIMQNRPVTGHKDTPEYKRLEVFCDKVETEWTTPNGDEIEFAIHKWKWLNELTCGFYNELTWPTVPVYAQRKGISEFEAGKVLEKAQIHHKVGQEYAKILRRFLETTHRIGIDTPFLCGQDMVRNGAKNVGGEMYDSWKEWKDLDFEGRPERDSRGVRVCDYKIREAVAWAREIAEEGHGGIIWYYHQEVGKWLAEALLAAGIKDAIHCPAGEHSNRTIIDPQYRGRIMVASIDAHGQGKNLQHFSDMFVLQWPRSAKLAEQLLGRLHRRGQLADELYIRTLATMIFDEENFAACLNDSLYIHQSTGNKQKLIYAAYDPKPRIFPASVLAQRGLEVVHLTPEQQRMFNEKFGDTK